MMKVRENEQRRMNELKDALNSAQMSISVDTAAGPDTQDMRSTAIRDGSEREQCGDVNVHACITFLSLS